MAISSRDLDRDAPRIRVVIHRSGGGASRARKAAGLGLALALISSALLFYPSLFDGRFLLGVRLLGEDVGTLRADQAGALMNAGLARFAQRGLTLRSEGREFYRQPGELGYRFDVPATLERALAVGRGGPFVERLDVQWQALLHGQDVALVLGGAEGAARAALADLAASLDQPAQDAALRLEGQRLELVAARPGRRLDQEATRRLIEERLLSLSEEPIDLPMTADLPRIVETDLAPLRDRAMARAAQGIPVHYVKRDWAWKDGPVAQDREIQWSLKGTDLLAVVMVRSDERQGSPRPVLAINAEQAKPFLDRLAREVEQEPRDARFEWKDGRLQPLVTSRHGHALQRPAALAALEAALAAGEGRVELPVTVTKAKVALEDAPGLGLREVVVERSTPYAGGSPERNHNVELGARRIHGIVIPPGGTFSFLEAVGDISLDTGFQMGFAIVEKETVPDAGGGICQVSTTLFQSAFHGGYTILERWPHAYRIRRYEQPLVGLDATVYGPTLDLKFRNDTAEHLLIQANADGERLSVSLYGTKPLWDVRVEGPFLSNVVPADRTIVREETPVLARGRQYWVEQAEDGVTVGVKRTVVQGGQVLRQAVFTSEYRPQRNVLLVGTGG